jgi:hypothetical protein
MIKNDDVGAIARIPLKLSRAAKRTLAKFVLDFIRTNPNIYDGQAWFRAGNNNLFAAALSAVELAQPSPGDAQADRAQQRRSPGHRAEVPADPVRPAGDGGQPLQPVDQPGQDVHPGAGDDMIPVWYWTDTNDWCTVADPADIPTIEMGFLDGREEPELFVQDNPTVGSLFSNDKLTWKIRHIYGGNVTDFRGATKAVV